MVFYALASRFEPGSDPWLATWLALSGAGAIYSWSYDQVLLFVPIVIAGGVLVAAGREAAARRLTIGGALTFLLVSPVLYAIAVIRHDETFSIVVPVAFFVAIDEIQMGTDLERGHVFTDRMLNRRGREETLVLGAQKSNSTDPNKIRDAIAALNATSFFGPSM